MRTTTALLVCTLLFVGCATVKQAKSDVQTGYTAPLAPGEQSPAEQARPIAAGATTALTTVVPVAAPFAMPIQGAIASALGLFFAWQRGRGIRKGKPVSDNPITGFFGNKIGAEALVQNLSNVVTGAFEVGKDGSPLKRAWKTGLTTLLGLGGVALTFPQAQTFLIHNPAVIATIGGLSALFGGLEKTISTVLPVSPDSGTGTPPPTNPAIV